MKFGFVLPNRPLMFIWGGGPAGVDEGPKDLPGGGPAGVVDGPLRLARPGDEGGVDEGTRNIAAVVLDCAEGAVGDNNCNWAALAIYGN